jgi:hypothetical protein
MIKDFIDETEDELTLCGGVMDGEPGIIDEVEDEDEDVDEEDENEDEVEDEDRTNDENYSPGFFEDFINDAVEIAQDEKGVKVSLLPKFTSIRFSGLTIPFPFFFFVSSLYAFVNNSAFYL